MQQTKMSETEWRIQQAKNARNLAMVMQILQAHPEGLTTQQIVGEEQKVFGFTFLTDNRLREGVKKGWIKKTDEVPCRWTIVKDVA